MPSFIVQPLDTSKQPQWLREHIPHRIRAVLPGIPMLAPWDIPTLPIAIGPEQKISYRCLGNSVWEGRHTGLRWLIELVGIVQSERGDPSEFIPRRITDMRIDRIEGGIVIETGSAEAAKLAPVWKGCSQASMHPTTETNHPDISERVQAEALHIIISHLDRTIYKAASRTLFNAVMVA